jgi:hypothetical protein
MLVTVGENYHAFAIQGSFVKIELFVVQWLKVMKEQRKEETENDIHATGISNPDSANLTFGG